MAERLVQAARDALPTADAAVARAVLAADLVLLADLDAQVGQATDQLARLVPLSPFAPLLTRPGLGVRSGPGTTAAPSVTRPGSTTTGRSTALPGLNPIQYESPANAATA